MDTNQIKNIVRVGRVSSVNGAKGTARVTFPDKESLVSAELPVLQVGSNGTEGYWVPEVDTQVLCLFLPNPAGRGINAGFILGAFYSTADPPPETDPDVRALHFADGSYIRHDHGNIEIHATGNITITGANIYLN